MMRDESLQCSLSLHEPPSKSRPSESSSSGWLGARLGSGGAQKGMIEQWLLPILIDPRSSQLLDVERVQRCLFELLDLLRNNLDHFPSLSAPPQLEVQVQSAKYASAGSLQSVLGGIRPPPIF